MSTTLSPSGLVAPAVTDKVGDTIAALAANFQLLNDYLHPVGSIAYFATSFDPNAHWGGTWVEDTSGRTDVASSTAHPAGSTWGSETHQITIAEMPAHAHALHDYVYVVANGGNSGAFNVPSAAPGNCNTAAIDSDKTRLSKSAGGGAAMSLAQPSTAVHKWVRTA